MGTYTGTSGSDTIIPGTVSAGVIRVPAGSSPSAAADTINGAGGGDTLAGGDGNDTIYDRPVYGANEFALSGNAGNLAHGDGGNDDITIEIGDTGGTNIATNAAYGDDGNDAVLFTLRAREYPDGQWLGSAPTGTVSLYGGAGSDDLSVRAYYLMDTPGMTVNQYGGTGDDVLKASVNEYDPDGSVTGMNNTDNLYGGTGNDRYAVIEAQDNVIENPGEGTDTVYAEDMDYTLPVNVENLEMTVNYYSPPNGPLAGTGNAADNRITVADYAYETSYVLNGKGGNDIIYGSSGGSDTIIGDVGNDTLYGKKAGSSDYGYLTDSDVIRGGSGNDLIYGGGGDKDTWDGDDSLYGDDGNDRIFGSFGNDRMYGGAGVDELGGQAGNDTMYGGAGNDKLGGGTGIDRLYGDADADVLAGREGADQLWGGTGNDLFDYDKTTDSGPGAANRDVIYDFVGVGKAVGDRIDLATIDANTSAGGNQAFVFKGAGAITGAGQVHVVKSGADTLIQANTGGSNAPELEILVKDGTALHTQWIAGDFIL